MNFKDLVKRILRHDKDANLELIEKTFLFVYNAYKDEKRISGEPAIEHNLQCAYILAGLGMDEKTIIAGLLHDVLQHGKAERKELKEGFGEEIANLVEGVTSLAGIKKGMTMNDITSVNLRKLLLAT